MNDPVQRILTALNHTEAPSGLEDRVGLRLQEHAALHAGRSWTGFLAPLTAKPWRPIAAASFALLFFAAVATVRHHAAHHAAASPEVAQVSAPAGNHPLLRSDAAAVHVLCCHSTAKQSGPQLERRQLIVGGSTAMSLAALETSAPSLAPPTLPLTANERIMQAAVRHAELPQLIALHTPEALVPGIAPIFAGFLPQQAEEDPHDAEDTSDILNDNPTIPTIPTGDTQ